jgi:hypothetical protein
LSNHTSTGEALSAIDLNNVANHPSRSAGAGGAAAAASKPLRGGASSSSAQPPVLLTTVMVAIAVCCVASIAMSTTHVQYQFGDGSSSSGVASIDSRQPSKKRTNGDNGGSGSSIAAALSDFHGQQNKANTKEDSSLPFYPKLQCKAYGGPSEKEAQEMVYWQGKCMRGTIEP